MPKVDAEHVQARRRQILDAARRCFARKGFAGTSMGDIVRESGLSTGAIYSYFKGKDELIAAVAGGASTVVVDSFSDGGLLALLERVRAMTVEDDHAKLIAQVWGAASTSASLATTVRDTQTALRDEVARLIETHRQEGRLPAGPAAEHVADAFLALCSGFNMMLAVDADVDVAAYAGGLRAILEQR